MVMSRSAVRVRSSALYFLFIDEPNTWHSEGIKPQFSAEGFSTQLSKLGYRVSRLLMPASGAQVPNISALLGCSAGTLPPPPPTVTLLLMSGASNNVHARRPAAPANAAGFCRTWSLVRFDLYGGSGQKPSSRTML